MDTISSAKSYDNHPSPSPSNQDFMKIAVGNELGDYTWRFDANRLAIVSLPKFPKSPLGPDKVDSFDAYIDNVIKQGLQLVHLSLATTLKGRKINPTL